MSIVAARVDNRLLHGIVATQWVPEFKPQRLMIIDDEYADDPTKKAGMRMAKPAGVALSIINRQKAYDNFAAGKYDDHTVFVVVRDPQIVLDLQRAGQKIPRLTVGGTVDPAPGVGATRVSRRAHVFDSQVPIYAELAEGGCDVTVQYVCADKCEPLSKFVSL